MAPSSYPSYRPLTRAPWMAIFFVFTGSCPVLDRVECTQSEPEKAYHKRLARTLHHRRQILESMGFFLACATCSRSLVENGLKTDSSDHMTTSPTDQLTTDCTFHSTPKVFLGDRSLGVWPQCPSLRRS